MLDIILFMSISGYIFSSVEAHSGTVWCLQHKREILVTGSHDKTVSVYIIYIAMSL